MPRSGRDTILRHVDQACNALGSHLYHLKQIDDIYSGASRTDDEGNPMNNEYIDIKETDPYAKYRTYIQELVIINDQLDEMTKIIKSF